MGKTRLTPVTVYLTEEEYTQVAEDAVDHGVTVSAYVRARLGFTITWQGAPAGNQNRKKPTPALSIGKHVKIGAKRRRG